MTGDDVMLGAPTRPKMENIINKKFKVTNLFLVFIFYKKRHIFSQNTNTLRFDYATLQREICSIFICMFIYNYSGISR